jgi:hypothetical protein
MYKRLQVSFYFLKFWSAIVRTYEWLQVFFFFFFWSAIVHMYEQLQVFFFLFSGVQSFARTNDCKFFCFCFFFFCFVECNCSHVRTIASHIERSEGMDRWSWSYAPHKNPLVIFPGRWHAPRICMKLTVSLLLLTVSRVLKKTSTELNDDGWI